MPGFERLRALIPLRWPRKTGATKSHSLILVCARSFAESIS